MIQQLFMKEPFGWYRYSQSQSPFSWWVLSTVLKMQVIVWKDQM